MPSKKLIAGAGCAIAVTCLVIVLWSGSRAGGSAPPPADTASPAPSEVEPTAPASARRQPVPAPIDDSRITGTVRDETGLPLAGVQVQILLNPSERDGLERWQQTETLRSDERGRFTVPVLRNAEAKVICPDLRFRIVGTAPRVQAPAEVELVVSAHPRARLLVRVRNQATGELLSRFGCSFQVLAPGSLWSPDSRPFRRFRTLTEDGELEQILPLPTTAGRSRVEIVLNLKPPIQHRLLLSPGEEREVELVWVEGPSLAGVVLDADGKPVSEALVYSGSQERARGNTPFEPLRRLDSVHDGVRTDADGRFILPSGGTTLVTAWHPDHTAITVPVAEAQRIVLPALGGIRGRLIDRAGRARAGVEICMDRQRLAVTDDDGGFRFDKVEAGIRGLHIPGPRGPRHLGSAAGGPWSVRVAPGRIADLILDPGFDEVVLQIVSAGRPYREPMGAWASLVGTGDLASFVGGKIEDGRLVLRGVLPADYVLVTSAGHVARCRVDGPVGVLEVGDAALTVEAEPGTRFCLVPQGANHLVRLMAARARERVPESGTLVFAPLAEGTYELWRRGDRDIRTVRISGPETRVVFD